MSEAEGGGGQAAADHDQLTSLISDEVERQLRERGSVLEAMREQMAKVLAEFEEVAANVSSKRSWSNSVAKTKPFASPKRPAPFEIHPVVTPLDIVPQPAVSPPRLPKLGGGLLKSIHQLKRTASGGALPPGGPRSPDGRLAFDKILPRVANIEKRVDGSQIMLSQQRQQMYERALSTHTVPEPLSIIAMASDTVLAASATTFSDLPLHGDVSRALGAMRFLRPSPIQLHALPVALFGNDVVGQAKSGTGKTAVFGVTAVEHAIRFVEKRCQAGEGEQMLSVGEPLALILAPTREIAVQIETVLRQLAQFRPELVIRTCIGGLPVAQDQRHLAAGCHIVVGTPGRVKALIDQCSLPCSAIRLLVLDEVDKLMARDFERDIQYIADALPERRQTLAFSATFTPDQLVAVVQLTRTPQIVRVRGPNDVTTEFISSTEDLEDLKEREQASAPELWLRHVRQFYSVVEPSAAQKSGDDVLNMKAKVVKLAALLSEIVFVQCMVFCNDKFRAEALATALAAQGWPAACITGSQTQATRLEVMESFRASRSRVLVSTDLTARGIDVDKVNFVVNLDLPRDPATYLHRVGRTGRFGGKGLAVTLLSKNEVQGLQLLARVFKMKINVLPSPVPAEIYTYATDNGNDEDRPESVVEEEHSDEEGDMCIAHSVHDDEVMIPNGEWQADNLSSREISSRYEREERSYETWIELL
ncbi:putative DEAD/DEAH box RNA helicase [Phytophthora cinnamomi]|uniref:putative DEAD/DEAH box RNA helicase n=1 Tax=Phytophthora cinnamomi TaxID=4785 RepID=UPI003559AE1E|nr:putative DEAD/DEAH box RNA helicase [Phytophthora cinnamomi]